MSAQSHPPEEVNASGAPQPRPTAGASVALDTLPAPPEGGPLRVLALVTSPLGRMPAQRFRIEQWAPGLARLGITLEFDCLQSPELEDLIYRPANYGAKARMIAGGMLRRAQGLRHAKEFDVVYVLRESARLGPALFERWLASAHIPYVFDFDDAIFLPNVTRANRAFGFLKCPGKTATSCRLAAHVMAGNQYLAEYARRFNSSVTVVPTTIDTEKYQPPQQGRESPTPLLVWTGSRTTVPYLESLAGPLAKLRARHNFRLRVVGAPKVSLPGLDVELVPWKAETEATVLQGAWAGLMPVPDGAWGRGKCGCKALQYMAVGVPAICSPVGVNSEIIEEGENGFMASSDAEWVEKLDMLLTTPKLRRQMGELGRATVKGWYSAEVQVPRVARILRSAACRAPRQRTS